ncbi:8043_t:CDS:2, partial [Racocetra fulgida]
ANELFSKIRISHGNAQLNTRICGVLIECINLAEFNLKNLQAIKRNHAAFATLDNYKLFQRFLQNIRKINSFIKNISNLRGLNNYIRESDSGFSLGLIKVEFEQLFEQFNKSMSSIKFKTYTDEQVNSSLNDDIEETTKLIYALQRNFKGDYGVMFKAIERTSTRLATKSTFSIDELLGYSIQKEDGIDTKNLDYNEYQMDLVCVYAALLKNLGDFVNVNIIKFYGISQNESSSGSMYLITEKAEHGNLKEYYAKYKPLDLSVKLKFALDICTGLVFLNAVNVLHRDIRSENILITSGLNAKIANFTHSRLNSGNSSNLGVDRARIKSMAPEIVERKHSSLCKTLFDIVNNPGNTPALYVNTPVLCVKSSKGTFSQHSFLSIEDAAKEARKKGGNKQKALEYIDEFSEMGDFKAIYYKACFMQQKFYGKHKLSKYKKLQKEVAHLFELASDANITDAHTKYGDCLFNGYGVPKNQARAIELYRKAANDGIGNVKFYAQFRLGSIYYEGLAGKEDKEEGTYYLKLAAWGNYKKAIDFCKKYKINYQLT